MTEEKWYSHSKPKVRFTVCAPPFDNIFVGSTPLDGMTLNFSNSFQAIVNVSHSPETLFLDQPNRDLKTYWIPINEMGEWSYSSLTQFCHILEYHHNKGHRVYVHCHAGVYRSVTLTKIWLYFFHRFRDDTLSLGWLKASAVVDGYSDFEEYKKNRDYKIKNNRHLKFLKQMPPNFFAFMTALASQIKSNREGGYSYIIAMEYSQTKSNEYYSKRRYSNSLFYTIFKSPLYKLKNKVKDIHKRGKDFFNGMTYVQTSQGVREHTQGDHPLRRYFLKK